MKKVVYLLIASIVAVALLTFSNSIYVSKAQTTNVQATLYAGELYSANGTLVHGAFGLTSTNLSSPGPTLYFTAGTVVNLTLVNVGKVGHGWALTDSPQTNATRLFNAIIGSGIAPVAANKSESVTFTVGSAGTYYYICPVPGHVALGMWGTVIVVNPNNAKMTIYAGELYDANNALTHGAFGLAANTLDSPGPTLYFTANTAVNVTLVNVGKVGHAWAITSAPDTNANRLFNATIGDATNRIAPGNSSSVVFTAGSPGTYYYICPVPGHVGLGMWGVIVIVPNTTIIPEFTSWLGIAGILIMTIVARIMLTMKGKQKSRIKTIFL
ncbi:MAG TPA: plastocyanin/azurin family copper-binding protein [Candidatus Sulfotelmatobacter sp.]|nr:plastocyanin/azurin family copper-binding protein [Candidatus Sulfotelmatobacter sp.]